MSTIFSVAVLRVPSVPPPLGFDSVRFSGMLPVAARSFSTVTVKLCDVWPAANVSVPDVAT